MAPVTFVRVVVCATQGRRPGSSAAKCAARGAASAAAVAAAVAVLLSPDSALAAGLTSAGRLDKCRGDEACVSTSSVGNPVKFAAPWTYESQTSDAAVAWAALKDAVLRNRDGGAIVESKDGPADFYMRAEFPSFPKGTEYVCCERRGEHGRVVDRARLTGASSSRAAQHEAM
jgi:hypothetical protein